jgi:hypothetical protein
MHTPVPGEFRVYYYYFNMSENLDGAFDYVYHALLDKRLSDADEAAKLRAYMQARRMIDKVADLQTRSSFRDELADKVGEKWELEHMPAIRAMLDQSAG